MKISTSWEGHTAETMGEEGGGFLRGIVQTGDAQIVDIRIARESPFRGIIVDESGTPIPEVEVMLWYRFGRGGGSGVGSAKSDEKGEFEVNGAPASVSSGDLEIKFKHPDFTPKIQKGLQAMTVSEKVSMKVTLPGPLHAMGIKRMVRIDCQASRDM